MDLPTWVHEYVDWVLSRGGAGDILVLLVLPAIGVVFVLLLAATAVIWTLVGIKWLFLGRRLPAKSDRDAATRIVLLERVATVARARIAEMRRSRYS